MSLCLSCWFRWMLSFLFLLPLLSLSAFPFASEENTKYKTIAFSFVWLRADEDATCLKFRERCSRPFSLLLVYIFWCPCFARARVCVCVWMSGSQIEWLAWLGPKRGYTAHVRPLPYIFVPPAILSPCPTMVPFHFQASRLPGCRRHVNVPPPLVAVSIVTLTSVKCKCMRASWTLWIIPVKIPFQPFAIFPPHTPSANPRHIRLCSFVGLHLSISSCCRLLSDLFCSCCRYSHCSFSFAFAFSSLEPL